MPWPLYTTAARPPAVNNATNTGLYEYGSQAHSFSTRVWITTNPSLLTPSAFTASFTQLKQVRKANWEPADADVRDITHLQSPFRFKERRASWGNPGRYSLEFNFTTQTFETLSGLRSDPSITDENHRYMIVEDPNGSVHQLYGFFQPPRKSHDVTGSENVIEQAFESCGLDTYVRSA